MTFSYLCRVKKRVVIGLSGGVDSSVAACLLREQGYDVTGLFMRNWHDTTGLLQSDCHWEDDLMFAEMVAKKAGIPFHMVDLSEAYKKRVVDYMFSEYGKGRTPNPDILCNREIKFDSFAVEAKKLGADFIATGHYCRKDDIGTESGIIHRLLSGKDKNKDQSYFLCQISQEQLAETLFPLGNLTKEEVRTLAAGLRLPTARRKDSQGICFIGKVHLPVFLQQKLKSSTGPVIEIDKNSVFPSWPSGLPDETVTDDELIRMSSPHQPGNLSGTIIGNHHGAHFFTIGQRKGINIGGHREPLFVIGTDTDNNILYMGEGQSHPGLYRKGLFVRASEIHWIRSDLAMNNGGIRDCMVRIRYRQPLQHARLFMRKEGMYVIFDRLQRSITPGQFAAWYDGDEVTGSGVIDQ